MLRTNHGFWFLCAVLQGNSPPAFSLVFLLPFLLSLSHYLHFLSFTYITCTYVYIYLYISFITLQYIISLYMCHIRRHNQTTFFLSLLSFSLFYFILSALSSYPVLLFHALPTSESQHFFAHPRSIPFSASACVRVH